MIGGFNLVEFEGYIEDLEEMSSSITTKIIDYNEH